MKSAGLIVAIVIFWVSGALAQGRKSSLAFDFLAGLTQSQTDAAPSAIGYCYHFGLESAFSPSAAFRMEGSYGLLLGGKPEDSASFNNLYNSITFSGRIYLSNIIRFNDSLNRVNMFIDAGAGMMYSDAKYGRDKKDDLPRYKTGDFCFPLGIGLSLPLGRGTDLTFLYRYLLTNTDWLDGRDPDVFGLGNNDAFASFSLGLSIKLNAKDETPIIWPGAFRETPKPEADSLANPSVDTLPEPTDHNER